MKTIKGKVNGKLDCSILQLSETISDGYMLHEVEVVINHMDLITFDNFDLDLLEKKALCGRYSGLYSITSYSVDLCQRSGEKTICIFAARRLYI